MRFAIDAHAICRRLTGNEVYARALLTALAAQDGESEFIAYIANEAAKKLLPASVATRAISANPFLRLGIDFAAQLRRDRPALLHVQYTAPLNCPVPVVATVHDVSYIERPEYLPQGRAMQLRLTVGRTVQRAAAILTGSEFSKAGILRAYPRLAESKVIVAPCAAAPEFRPVSRSAAAIVVRECYGIAGPFILSVGDLRARKNHIGLIRAFARLVRAFPQFKHQLALVGKETSFARKVRDEARDSGVADRIRFLGYVPDSDLLQLYNACALFVFPSFYEGFGIPVLEAMACGRSVVCSNASALPEVADGAAILVDPNSADQMARAMADLLLDSELRARMERLGLMRAAHFSWQKTARITLATFYEVTHARARRVPVSAPSIAQR